MREDLPSGTVTFLFTDVEGSTRLLHELGAEGYAAALSVHRRLIREACAREDGVEVDTQGDAFFFAFPTAPGAIEAAGSFTETLASGPIQVRVGLHTGTPLLAEEGYVGGDVHRAARIAAAGHGGQVLVSASTAALVEMELRDLGEHRFKDLGAPERVYQLGSVEFPALKTLYRTNLPVSSTPFLGREQELADVLSLLEEARLLTLTGPGGTGKTRLALQAAAAASDAYPDGVYWVPLAPLRDPALVIEEASRALGAKNGLAEHIADKRLLLLFDNFEQVVEAASGLPELLASCPNLDVLVTSRELLQLPAEHAYPVPPLAEEDGVEFFTARARAVLPTFISGSAVPELCAKLDQLPLALELAAARMRVMSPEQLLERLSGKLDLLKAGRGADRRQQTLRAAIEWSYELLSEDEQRLFARLACFRGGCTLDAAEEICEADLDSLQALVDKSLVRYSNERYWMLATISEYAVERLRAAGDERMVRDRHLGHLLALAERAYEALLLGAESDWLQIMEVEHDNIRSGLEWARDGSSKAETQLAGAIAPYWSLRGHQREALEWLSGALSRYEARDRIRARALMHRGELEDALPTLDDALQLWRELDDARGEALALESIGWAHDHYGDYCAAQLAYEQSLAIRREIRAPEIEGAPSRAGLCHALVAMGEVEGAQAMAQELLAVAVESDASLMQELALHFLADCPLVGGDYPEAERRYLRALAYARSAGLVGRATDEVLGVAMARAGQADYAYAIRLAAASYAKQVELGKIPDHWWRTMQEHLLGSARAQLRSDELDAAERAGRETSFDALLDEVLGTHTEPDA